MTEFSFQTRANSIEACREADAKGEDFDLLIVGGGITGASVARDAAMRGLKVALIERGDFACLTSSASSKLIHGGLRYLEQFEFPLVFEALSERALLLNNHPQVQPMPFLLPVYKGGPRSRFILKLGMCLYDLLSLFRSPGAHSYLNKKNVLKIAPNLKSAGLRGGFRYFDAAMWDDRMTVENARSASDYGAKVMSYVEATSPLWRGTVLAGFKVQDRKTGLDFSIRAARTVLCLGPTTDQAKKWFESWVPALKPSRGLHLFFEKDRLPVQAAVVMSHPEDHRISFVIPRNDFGPGVVMVGTTDGPVVGDISDPKVLMEDVDYLLGLLNIYFPSLKLSRKDIVATTIGVRPLVDFQAQEGLQASSREHHIGEGPGGVLWVAGGKYTTHRTMAQEVVEHALMCWREANGRGEVRGVPIYHQAHTKETVFQAGNNPKDIKVASSVHINGFPDLDLKLRQAVQSEMVLSLVDFYFRREPLYVSLKDHGLNVAEKLAEILADELQVGIAQRKDFISGELRSLKEACSHRDEGFQEKVANRPERVASY